jgi:hypothetical protein
MMLCKTTAVSGFQPLTPANRVTYFKSVLQPVHDGDVPLRDSEIGVQ